MQWNYESTGQSHIAMWSASLFQESSKQAESVYACTDLSAPQRLYIREENLGWDTPSS